jgi:hypothetical protein
VTQSWQRSELKSLTNEFVALFHASFFFMLINLREKIAEKIIKLRIPTAQSENIDPSKR